MLSHEMRRRPESEPPGALRRLAKAAANGKRKLPQGTPVLSLIVTAFILN
jgi:hypothetical protein